MEDAAVLQVNDVLVQVHTRGTWKSDLRCDEMPVLLPLPISCDVWRSEHTCLWGIFF